MAATLRCAYGLRGLQGVIPRLSIQQCRQMSGDDSQRKHPETPQSKNPPKGKIFDKKPFKMALKAEKNYHWCACGTSKNQPMCDGSHKQLEKETGYKWQPLRFQVEKEKEFWLCNCKQTSKAPFCDGTHTQPQIQAAIK